MIKLFLTILIGLSGFTAYAETIENPLLWKAEKDGKVAYLFGTFHLGFTKADLPESFFTYLDSSKYFFMEANLHGLDEKDYLARASYDNGQSLDQFLPEDTWTELTDLFKGMVPEDQLKTYKPWFVMNDLAAQVAMGQTGLTGTIDLELLKYAADKALTVGFLENIGLQLSVIEAITPSHVLDEALRKPENLIEQTVSIITDLYGCYLVSDLTCLTEKLSSKKGGGELEEWQADLVIKQRNITWVPQIEKSLESGQTFVAVGAGHLVGKGSVLELLEAEGYTVNRVEF